jgi:hypothetical protein
MVAIGFGFLAELSKKAPVELGDKKPLVWMGFFSLSLYPSLMLAKIVSSFVYKISPNIEALLGLSISCVFVAAASYFWWNYYGKGRCMFGSNWRLLFHIIAILIIGYLIIDLAMATRRMH